MHELSIASAIVESVLEFVSARPVKRVLAVRLAIGELSHIEADQLRFCYTAITEQTPIQDSNLEIETVEAVVRCERCSYSGRPKYWDDALSAGPILTLQCPNCGAAVEAIEGDDCAIKSIRFAVENDGSAIPAA
ncbi:MAG TPA: hydrogenase maturation nickel metallochaperone HypA [Chthoniobacterales bacterium]|nr:hydrogenase maturation nickel metallochaperone HypA [Chthoniobacterales bacterium]